MSFECDCGKMKKAWIDPDKKVFCKDCHSELRELGQRKLEVYSSVPCGDLKDLDIDKIKDLLLQNRGVFFRSKDIADKLKIADKGSCPKIRKAITSIIFMGYPIVSTVKGYSLPKNKEQVKAYIESLEGRSRAIDRRIKALQDAVAGDEMR